jgi:hypothetical protein
VRVLLIALLAHLIGGTAIPTPLGYVPIEVWRLLISLREVVIAMTVPLFAMTGLPIGHNEVRLRMEVAPSASSVERTASESRAKVERKAPPASSRNSRTI